MVETKEILCLTEQEKRLISLIRRTKQGELKIVVARGLPVQALVIDRKIDL